jgi:hypothetical protein
MIQPKQYARKVTYVTAIQVTPANISEVAEWCKGVIEGSAEGNPAEYFIRVKVFRAANERQTQAFVGDWVLKTMPNKDSFKVWTNPAFFQHFTDASLDMDTDCLQMDIFEPTEVATPIFEELTNARPTPKPAPRIEMGEHVVEMNQAGLAEWVNGAQVVEGATVIPNNI